MAAPGPSSMFLRLANAFRVLALRSDIDNIILEILGQFSLEKIYAEGDREAYQQLIVTLLAQLNTIFVVQRLTLPSEKEKHQFGWYLGFLASWEVTLRSIEFVLQVVEEGRESLWEARLLRDKYLADFLINTLRFLTLHPKIPTSQRAKDRRDRFARINRALERVFDSYTDSESFLLLVCRELTNSLKLDPNGLALPPKLRAELPNLATELYPLPECLQSQSVSLIVPQGGFPGDWLSQFLALRDVSLFVVGASVQYVAKGETKDARLQTSSARTRTAVLHALENIAMPQHLDEVDLIATFNETFRIILPDTLNLSRRNSAEADEIEIDAIDSLCTKLIDRQVVNRVSDRQVMHSITEITRNISLLDDPNGRFQTTRPKYWAINCPKLHLAGDSQLRASDRIKLPQDENKERTEIILPPKSKCVICGEPVTLMREVSLARRTWDLLKPLEANPDTINVERHLQTQFQLPPPKMETGMPFHQGFSTMLSEHSRSPASREAESSSPPRNRSMFVAPGSPDRARAMSISQALVSPVSPGLSPGFSRQILDTPRSENGPTQEDMSSSDGITFAETLKVDDGLRRPSIATIESPMSSDCMAAGSRVPSSSRLQSVSTISSPGPTEPEPLSRSRTVPFVAPPDKGKSMWKKFTSKREPAKSSGESSSISSSTLEAQKLEEFPLKSLLWNQKSNKGKSSKPPPVAVYLSQNSTYALFYTQAAINIWDIGTSSPLLGRSIATESNCVLAAVTKMHLAYIIGTRDQKLTLRIINIIQTAIPPIEYRMPSSPWCTSICICPKENFVVVGFENSAVRFFNMNKSEEPREDRLHSRWHIDCKACPPVDTLSFSNDGLVLLASTRHLKTGTIQIYLWRFPFVDFGELASCRYHVPLHESEDGGVSSAIYRSGLGGEENLICITTCTQSGIPILIEPYNGHTSEIRTEPSSHQGKLGSRIQCAAFSPSGRELAMVNTKGHLYVLNNLNSSPMEIKRIATSKELTIKQDWFAMGFMSFAGAEEDAIVMAWADTGKAMGFVKKVPVRFNPPPITPMTPTPHPTPRYELATDTRETRPPAELEIPAPLNIVKGTSKEDLYNSSY